MRKWLQPVGRLRYGIDLGTANTLIASASGDILVNEPSVVTVRSRTGAVESAGADAYRALGRSPEVMRSAQPVRGGVVTDLTLAEALLRTFLNRPSGTGPGHIDAAIAVPCGITDVERFALLQCAQRAGVRRVALIDQVLAAAHGCGVILSIPQGAMVIDIGAGLIEIGVFSLGSIVESRTAALGGETIDHAIAEYVRQMHQLLIGVRTAEEVKMNLSAPNGENSCGKSLLIRGRCLIQGLPKTVSVCEGAIREAIAPTVAAIARVVKSTLDSIPPELSADLIETGAVLTGGTALLPGLAERLSREMHISVRVDPRPTMSVALGLSRIIHDARLWRRIAAAS